jgi:hypothetical protein
MTQDRNLFGEELPRVGAPLFKEIWTNRKSFWIGVYTGQGLTATSITRRYEDGSTPNMITAMWSQWEYSSGETQHTYAAVPVPLSGIHRTMIDAEAERRNMDMQDICRAVLETVAKENLWKALLDA